jgi:hypothetical protein
MPATTAFSSQGSTLKISISGSPTAILNIQDATVPQGVPEFDEITNLSSPSNFKEWLPILIDGGTVALTLVYNANDATHQYVQASVTTQKLEVFEFDINGTGTHKFNFSAYVSKAENKFAKGKAGMMTVDLRITGPVTFA